MANTVIPENITVRIVLLLETLHVAQAEELFHLQLVRVVHEVPVLVSEVVVGQLLRGHAVQHGINPLFVYFAMSSTISSVTRSVSILSLRNDLRS